MDDILFGFVYDISLRTESLFLIRLLPVAYMTRYYFSALSTTSLMHI